MKILITGGCGFIGSHLAEFYLQQGQDVHVIDNLSTGNIENISGIQKNPRFTFEHADLLTWNGLHDAVKESDMIYHLAAVVGMFKVIEDPLEVINTNIIGCARLFQAIQETNTKPMVIIASSSSVYGNSFKPFLSETDNLIIDPPSHLPSMYSISKLTNESIAFANFRSNKVPVILARLFNTVGPKQTGRYGMVIPRFVNQACHGEALVIYGDGHQTRSFCDVRDAIVALDLLSKSSDAVGEVINVGNDKEISIEQLALLVSNCAKVPLKTKYISYFEAYGVNFVDVTQRRPDLKKLRTLTGFTHQWSLEDTICDLINHTKKE